MNNNLLFEVLMRIIERGNTNGMNNKIDIFFAANKLTQEQYVALCEMLK